MLKLQQNHKTFNFTFVVSEVVAKQSSCNVCLIFFLARHHNIAEKTDVDTAVTKTSVVNEMIRRTENLLSKKDFKPDSRKSFLINCKFSDFILPLEEMKN
jgi:hypothetical protein